MPGAGLVRRSGLRCPRRTAVLHPGNRTFLLPELRHGHVGDQESAGLVAVERLIAAPAVRDLYGHAVAVGIGRDQDLRPGLPAQLLRQLKALRVLRVGIAHRRKLRIGIPLLRHDVEIRVAQLLREAVHGDAARPVQRRVDDRYGLVQLLIRPLPHAVDIVQIGPVRLLAQHGQKPPLLPLLEGNAAEIVEQVQLPDPRQDAVGDRAGDLGPVLPVDLVAVVLPGIVAGRHVDARHRPVFADGKGQLRRRPHGREQVCPDPLPHQDRGRQLRELL